MRRPMRRFGMARTAATLNIVLERLDPARNMARYYVLSVEPALFGDSALVRRLGPLECQGGPAANSSTIRRGPA